MALKTTGLLSPGDMGSVVAKALQSHGLRVTTCLQEGRSERTRMLAHEAQIAVVPTYEDLGGAGARRGDTSGPAVVVAWTAPHDRYHAPGWHRPGRGSDRTGHRFLPVSDRYVHKRQGYGFGRGGDPKDPGPVVKAGLSARLCGSATLRCEGEDRRPVH
jgi:hypothetical protein